MKRLECSSKGDTRFSAFFARVKIFDVTCSIEDHYQLSKRIADFVPKTWRDVKGMKPTHLSIGGVDYDVKYTEAWYELLWVKYLDQHPYEVEEAKEFDTFSDMFRSKDSVVCQADTIERYIKDGRQSILDRHSEFVDLINKNSGRKVFK